VLRSTCLLSRSPPDCLENALQEHPTSSASQSRLHDVFTMIKPDFNFLVGSSIQTLAFLAMDHKLIAFNINFVHLTGWLIHSLVSHSSTTFHTLHLQKCAQKTEKIINSLSLS
jgi:hypothetical protein